MIMQFMEYYLWVMLFTAVSILFELPFTGSKGDYLYLKTRVDAIARESTGWFIFTVFFVMALGSLLWPITFYNRLKDIWYRV